MNTHSRWTSFLFAAFGSTLVASLSPSDAAASTPSPEDSFTVVALEGAPAPGLPGLTFDEFDYITIPDINDSGQVAFFAMLEGPGLTYNASTSAWTGSSIDDVSLVARGESSQATTPAGATLADISPEADIDNQGRVRLLSSVDDGAGGSDYGIWISNSQGELLVMAKEGDVIDDLPTGPTLFPSGIRNGNDNAQVVFRGTTQGDTGLGIYVADSQNDLVTVAMRGQPAPGVTPGATFQGFGEAFHINGLNNQGQAAFFASTSMGDSGIWLGASSQSLSVIATANQQPPGAPAGSGFSFFSKEVRALDDGSAVFAASYENAGETAAGVWRGDGNLLTPVYIEGQPTSADGLSPANGVGDDMLVNQHGDIAFSGAVADDNGGVVASSGIWKGGSTGALTLVADTRDEVPGADGAAWDSLNLVGFNDRGQTLMVGRIDNPGQSNDGAAGYWGENAQGGIELLLLEGQQIDVDDGPGENLKTVDSVWVHTPTLNIGSINSFNERGEFAFSVEFTDGTSAIIVSNQLLVPEPSATLLALLSLSASLATARRR